MATATKSTREAMIGQWNDMGQKVLALGEAIPAAAFDDRPVDGVRTAGEIFRHLAFWNDWVAATAKGESPDGAANELPKSAAPTKAKALTAFEASVERAAKALGTARGPEKGELAPETIEMCASFLGHTAEHYGQLVVYSRLRGIVPPTSR